MSLKNTFLILLTLGTASLSSAGSIGLFNTGVDSTGSLLAGGSLDSHYSILETASSGVAIDHYSYPGFGAWLPPTSSSQWIWENRNGQPVNVTRTFRTTFDMSGFELATAVINGRWAADNIGLDILVNGASTGQTIPGSYASFNSWHSFSINSSLLVSGVNTIDFQVQDVGGISGFRAEFLTATADVAVPDSAATITLLGAVLLGMMGYNRRRSAMHR